MKLYQLLIARELYGQDKGQYKGTASFDDGDTKVQISLTPERAHAILRICSEGIIEAAEQTAKLTSANILASVALLENKVEQDL
jgi:hypothetical protein